MDASPGTSVAVAATPMGDDAQKNTRHTKNEKAQGLARIHRTGYSFEGLDDDKLWRSTPWHKPDILRARDFYKNQLFQQGKQPMMSYADVFLVFIYICALESYLLSSLCIYICKLVHCR